MKRVKRFRTHSDAVITVRKGRCVLSAKAVKMLHITEYFSCINFFETAGGLYVTGGSDGYPVTFSKDRGTVCIYSTQLSRYLASELGNFGSYLIESSGSIYEDGKVLFYIRPERLEL